MILQKSENLRTNEEAQMLRQCSEAVEEVQLRWKKRDEAKRRQEEFEEPSDTLQEKCQILARAIAQSQHLVVYTGAGISTAARIPDYRGPNGIWTRLQQGKDIGSHDLSLAEPTFTHMALSKLYHNNILKYVVSQNCDGLHLRSGLPRHALSELHGNMYIEVCKSCKPTKEYWRQFDVTENTARYAHKTMRRCYSCNEPLVDTIVHFGERGTLQWPLNWSGASKNAQKATTILCLGSSLKVLKRYPWLWQMDKPVKKRPNLYIVNLQWTPKDDCANVKIHGKCDDVMKIVMNFLGISVLKYDRLKDPIFYHSTALCDEELHTTTQPALKNVETKEYNEESQVQSPSSNCDIKCNTRGEKDTMCNSENELVSKLNVIPLKEQHFNKCDFSIDSILQHDRKLIQDDRDLYKDVEITSNFLSNYHTLVAYYRFSESIILQNPLLSYQDMLYYPYQTSFLYSGLHSIINNPFPLFNANFNNFKLNNSSVKTQNFNKPSPELIACHFCNAEFRSVSCLFYLKFEPVFVKKETEKKALCFCCDSSSDEEEEVKKEADGREEDAIDKDQGKVKIQAGWFGKGLILSTSLGNDLAKMQKLSVLMQIREQNSKILDLLNKKITGSFIDTSDFELPKNLPVQLPISTNHELLLLEQYLLIKENLQSMQNYLQTIGGKDTTAKTNRILKMLIRDALAQEYSFFGKRNKKPFYLMGMKHLVVRSVKATSKDASDKQIEDCIKAWLKHAPQRTKLMKPTIVDIKMN
ncbi:hypothetical protein FQR65_LT03834 [Abscondita terminalis]|nr:hypothetical protein FQR65_LT03834 [Abscondita terminalis]